MHFLPQKCIYTCFNRVKFFSSAAPLGVIDPLEQQSFYSNIGSTGQRGSVHAGGDLYLQERNDSANYVSGECWVS